ncbi:hypothetical protein ACSQ67_005494 [Phaseolus vulgaris]
MGNDGVPATAAEVVAVAAVELTDASNWWHDVDDSPMWQDRIFYTLAVLYGIVATVALVQLTRIQWRVPEYGWTTQKVFHFLNFLVNSVRCVVFIFFRNVQRLRPEARAVSTDGLKPSFYTINIIVYIVQVREVQAASQVSFRIPSFYHTNSYTPYTTTANLTITLWLILWWKPINGLLVLSKVFFAGVSLFAAIGFLLYGGRLFLMLQRFPVESKGRRKKLQEVGYVTTICFLCFLVRCVMMCFNAFDKDANLDVLDHPILNFIYYLIGGKYRWANGVRLLNPNFEHHLLSFLQQICHQAPRPLAPYCF